MSALARDRILAKLRQNAPSTANALPDVAAWYAGHRPAETAADKARRFRHFIEQAHAEVHAVTPGNWTQTLHAVLKARAIDRLLVAEGTPHGDAALDDLPPHGIDCSVYDMAIEAWKTEMFEATPASLTGARAAIAETGTLILWPDALEPRLMSLVPPVHIVLLDATRIHNTFFEAMTAEGWKDGLPTNALLISGPSKTADIQQTLAYGAHGPKELIVLLIETTEAAQ
ncbi:lactate utilization protein C [Azonexus sp.]|uniref:LutC/YkgG family protein n=1 Tax=Azonexus sp. TaxID=1872668 RepID=UPI0035AF5E99